MKTKKPESTIHKEIMLASGKIPTLRLFRNPNGVAFHGEVIIENPPVITLRNYRRVSYGLVPGSGDDIGWQTITITPDMVGKKIAQFVSVEEKTKTGRAREDQENWRLQVNSAGGKAVIIRDAGELYKHF